MKDSFNVQQTKSKAKKSYCDASMLLIILSVATFSSLSYYLWFTDVYKEQFQKFLMIKEGSYLYKSWVRPPISPLVCVYAFNYTNVDPFLKGYTDVLSVQETGPYCYKESTQKVQVQFHDNGTVSYRDNRTHQFVPEMSRGHRNDTLIVPNVPFFAVVAMARNLGILSRMSLMAVLSNAEPFSKVKAEEFFFGHDNTIMSIGNAMAKIVNRPVPYDKFGVLLPRKGVSKDLITVYTGELDPELTGQVYSVNGARSMTAWTTAECNAVRGSDGSRFPPAKVTAKAPVAIFSRDSCRSLPLVFHSEAKFQHEIPTHRYTINPDYFKARTNKHSCYCTATSDCSRDGVFDMSACTEGGAPILISQPHFLNGDPALTEFLDGLAPSKEKHQFFLDIHSKYGLTLGTVSRIQINVEVKKDSLMILKNVPSGLILPLIWMEISSEDMPEHMFNLMYHATFSVHYLEVLLMWTCLVLVTIATICLVRRTTSYLMQ